MAKSRPTKSRPSWQQALVRGMALRCPACGDGKLFKSYLKPTETCAACGLELNEWVGADGPSFFVMFIVITVVPVLALTVHMQYGPPLWAHIALWLPLTLILTLGLLPFFKGIFVAMEYKNKTDFFERSHGRKTKAQAVKKQPQHDRKK